MDKKMTGAEVLKAVAEFLRCDWRDLESALFDAIQASKKKKR